MCRRRGPLGSTCQRPPESECREDRPPQATARREPRLHPSAGSRHCVSPSRIAGSPLVAALALNLVIVPPVAFGLSQLAPAGRAVELGVLVILPRPCIDYVIVFTRLAGG